MIFNYEKSEKSFFEAKKKAKLQMPNNENKIKLFYINVTFMQQAENTKYIAVKVPVDFVFTRFNSIFIHSFGCHK